MSVLLLYSEFPDTFLNFKHTLKSIRKKLSLPPLSSLNVAALLAEGWAKRLMDINVRRLRESDQVWADGGVVRASSPTSTRRRHRCCTTATAPIHGRVSPHSGLGRP